MNIIFYSVNLQHSLKVCALICFSVGNMRAFENSNDLGLKHHVFLSFLLNLTHCLLLGFRKYSLILGYLNLKACSVVTCLCFS